MTEFHIYKYIHKCILHINTHPQMSMHEYTHPYAHIYYSKAKKSQNYLKEIDISAFVNLLLVFVRYHPLLTYFINKYVHLSYIGIALFLPRFSIFHLCFLISFRQKLVCNTYVQRCATLCSTFAINILWTFYTEVICRTETLIIESTFITKYIILRVSKYYFELNFSLKTF